MSVVDSQLGILVRTIMKCLTLLISSTLIMVDNVQFFLGVTYLFSIMNLITTLLNCKHAFHLKYTRTSQVHLGGGGFADNIGY